MYNSQLETFLVVAKFKSFNRAAEKLYISPPAVVKQINSLEQGLHLTLFRRTHRGLQLTCAGESLRRDAEFIIQYCRDAVERAHAAEEAGGDVIRIATSPMSPTQSLGRLWQEVHTRCPDLKFQLISHENTTEKVAEILGNLGKSVDMVVGYYDDEYLRRWKCRALRWSEEPVCCAVSVFSNLARKERLSVSDLDGRELWVIRRGWNSQVDRLRNDLQKDHPGILLQNFDLFRLDIFNACQELDSAVIAFPQWQGIHPLVRILPVDWAYKVPYGFLYAQEPSPATRRFLHVCQEKQEK